MPSTGMSCVAPRGAFYAMPQVTLPPGRTDADYVLALLREHGHSLRLRIGLRHRAGATASFAWCSSRLLTN